MNAVYLLFIFVGLTFLCPKPNNCLGFFSGLCFICLSGVQCICLYICLYPFSIHICISGLCSLCPAVSPMFLNVTSVIKNFQQTWLWEIYFLVCFSILCVPAVVSPLCYMLRRFWAPTPDLASESDQLYSHVHSQSRWRVYNLNCILMYIVNLTDECIHVQSQYCWCTHLVWKVHNLSWKSSKEFDFKMCFLLIETRCCVQAVCFGEFFRRQKGPELRLWNYKCALWSSARFLPSF